MRRQGREILVVGSGRVADALIVGLRQAERSVESLPSLDGTVKLFRAVSVVVFAAAQGDPVIELDTLVDLFADRRDRTPPLRVIVVGAAPSGLSGSSQHPGFSLETLDLELAFARDLFVRRPIHAGIDPPFGQVPHLLFVGHASPSRALAIQAMRLVHYGEDLPFFTFSCADPDACRESLLEEYPEAGRLCTLKFTGLEMRNLTGQPPITSIYVCMEQPEVGLETARRLADQIARDQGVSPLIHLEVGAASPVGDISDWDGQIVPFSWLREACRPEIWLDGQEDELAQVVHEHYRDSIAAQGRDPAAEPAGLPWADLEASYREANRYQADHLWAKLAVTDCRAVPEEQVESFAFAPLEVERLAVIEHSRWAADRYLNGWTYAPVRDNARKHHPQLIPFADLSAPMKDLDRFAVRLVPVLLARSGRGVERMLIVGLVGSGLERQADRSLSRLSEQVLTRLGNRYPDHSLVLASTLADAPARMVVRQALERFEAALFLLCPHPIGKTIREQPDAHARHDLLELVSRAERRICLSGEETLETWLAERAEVLLRLGEDDGSGQPVKQIALDPAGGTVAWNFEY